MQKELAALRELVDQARYASAVMIGSAQRVDASVLYLKREGSKLHRAVVEAQKALEILGA